MDDESMTRSALAGILRAEPDMEVVADCDRAEAVARIRGYEPDVVLFGFVMPPSDGFSVLAEMRTIPNRPAVAVLTAFDDEEHVSAALRLGADGFLLKDMAPEQLVHSVRILAGGGGVLAPVVGRQVIDGYLAARGGRGDQDLLTALTSRERDVLDCLTDGLSNQEIAARLHMGVSTVKEHVSAILLKLKVSNRVQAALLAQRIELSSAGAGGAAPGREAAG
ncbi:response regulator transcription factor [Streptomyces sp. MUM 178J]|uniref:response regulator transcription factor n=1 Tax=Streptomyces sp. MUM 178J TaxID=2791991 RepID=UPI0027E3365E|nr:response regulator transcription factor [Streptomyces sp. MUM 178J]WRQ82484.1 response regulator transcription factor [Streptomyces sp. MUM 178J]